MNEEKRRQREELNVAYARSTWAGAKEFMTGIRALNDEHPLAFARAYLTGGGRSADISPSWYDRVDELQALRRRCIQSEMKYVNAQAYLLFRDIGEGPDFLLEHGLVPVEPEDAQRLLEEAMAADSLEDSGTHDACARLLLGDEVVDGDSIAFGFSPAILYAAPSLGVYNLFMWFDECELESL